jgi:hypothetical protein
MKKAYYIFYFLFALFLFFYYVVIESPVAHIFNPFDGKFIWLMTAKLLIVVYFIDTALFLLFAALLIADLRAGKKVFPLNFVSLLFINVGNALHVYLFVTGTLNLMKAGPLPPAYLSLSKIYFYGIALIEIIVSVALAVKMARTLNYKTKAPES